MATPSAFSWFSLIDPLRPSPSSDFDPLSSLFSGISSLSAPPLSFDSPFSSFSALSSLMTPVSVKTKPSTSPKVPGVIPAPATSGIGEGVSKWSDLISETASKVGIPKEVIAAIMEVENASGNPTAKSVAGAMGLMQVMPFHFSSGENPFDPATNMRRGAELLKRHFDQFGNWESAAAAYFGAVNPKGVPTTTSDKYGTTGIEYVRRFRNALSKWTAAFQPKPPETKPGIFSFTGKYPVTSQYEEYNPDIWRKNRGYHTGIDIATPIGTRLTSPFKARVVSAGPSEGYGNLVVLDIGDYLVYLGHLDSIDVAAGSDVDSGTFLGTTGNTGFTTGEHLHLELRDKRTGRIISPYSYFSG